MADYGNDPLANASPQLLDLLAEYGLISPQQQFAARQMAEAEKMRNTPMPEGMTVRGQYIPPSILGIADATMKQIMGGQDAEREKQAIMAGFLRKMQANRAMGQHVQDSARSEMDGMPDAPRAATPEEQAIIGSAPKEYGVTPMDYIPEGELSHASAPPPAAKKPVVPPPAAPAQNMSPNPNVFDLLRSPFRGYRQSGLWPLPGGK